MQKKKILFLVGSSNQTTQMHQIAIALRDYDCFFSQLYSTHPFVKWVLKKGFLDNTILGGRFKQQSDQYLRENGLMNDYAASIYNNTYDLVVCCSDLLVDRSICTTKTVFVQEGMTDPVTLWAKIVHFLKLPALTAMNTAFNGSGNKCDIYCVASEGYKQQFIRYGTDAKRILVTGIPNYDNIRAFCNNNFPHSDYVMVATSDIRETFKSENRKAFIQNCVAIANGRQLLFKLHPNEDKKRAVDEIKALTPPNTLIYTEGNTGEMIANCDELITQYSTVVYIGIALGKKVHSYFDVDELKRLAPLQNDGTSATTIADICRRYVEHKGSRESFLSQYQLPGLQKV
ncbi:hypothetical protein [Chitinophaga ginsengisoli]|uniref:UDP-N-acetyl glucosamine 2-epimerase n=1 Tax=Chitinophaga ginsengisoli TaxID=363837 RepID=A0A2P8GNK9_9BACT|nr:hypothetical protein [Chitinophaga ginsengisoli]PSL35552.1 hypothetical protein CLV42_101312 [Chitinophaga ginsengisoli]